MIMMIIKVSDRLELLGFENYVGLKLGIVDEVVEAAVEFRA